MNIDKVIKKQALSYLAKDNWGTAIAGFFIMLLPFIVVLLLFAVLDGIFSTFLSEGIAINVRLILNYAILPCLLLCTPSITGYLKICYSICKGKNGELKDIFRYFSKELYIKTLFINISVIVRILIAFIVFMIPALAVSILYNNINNIFLYVLSLILALSGFVATLFFGIRYSIVPCVFFENENLTYKEVLATSKFYMKSKIKNVMHLLLTFMPHIILCFFVVPWIFIFPYITIAFMNNGKWITELYTDNCSETL